MEKCSTAEWLQQNVERQKLFVQHAKDPILYFHIANVRRLTVRTETALPGKDAQNRKFDIFYDYIGHLAGALNEFRNHLARADSKVNSTKNGCLEVLKQFYQELFALTRGFRALKERVEAIGLTVELPEGVN